MRRTPHQRRKIGHVVRKARRQWRKSMLAFYTTPRKLKYLGPEGLTAEDFEVSK